VTQAAHVKLIETMYMTTIGDPWLAAVQQASDDYSYCAQAFLPEA